jgi:hypothetical protein
VFMNAAGLGPENDCAGETSSDCKLQIHPVRQRGCYMRTMTTSVQLENKMTGRVSQGACCQDELMGGKPPVVK